MRICVCTTPIRPVPTTFPPFGSMAIIQSLRQVGEEVQFYNIDYFRFHHEEIVAYFAYYDAEFEIKESLGTERTEKLKHRFDSWRVAKRRA